MLTYFLLGLFTGVFLTGFALLGIIIRYRREVLSLKRVQQKLETLNTQMGQLWNGSQVSDSDDLIDQQRISAA